MKTPLSALATALTFAVAASFLAGPATASDHPIGGPRRHAPRAADGTGDATGPSARASKHAALDVNGIPVSLKTYRRVIKDGEASWRFLLDMFPLSKLTKNGQTKQEFLFLHEHAEPLVMRTRHADEVPELEALANDFYRRAKAGEDMSLLILKYSTDPSVGATKGETNMMGFSDCLHPLNRVAWQADVGEVLPPVQTVRGFAVAKVMEVVPAHDVPGADGAAGRHVPELRRLKQALFLFNSRHVDDDPGFAVLRREILALPDEIAITVLDDRLCDDLPNWCAARPGAWTRSPDDAEKDLVPNVAPK